MTAPLLNPRRVFVVVLGALLVLSLLPARWARVVAQPPRDVVSAALARFSQPLKEYVADPLRRPADLGVQSGDLETTQRNLMALQNENVRLLEQLAEEREKVAQLSRLRRERSLEGLDFLPAAVSAWRPDGYGGVLTIGRGTQHGLREGLVVVDGLSLNLVGRVVEAGPVTATVRTIAAPGLLLDVRFRSLSLAGSGKEVVKQLQADRKGDFVTQVRADEPVKVDDLAHLTDLSGSGWPAEACGFVVGKVIEVSEWPDNPRLYRLVRVRPLRSLAHLSRVVVLVPVDRPGPQR